MDAILTEDNFSELYNPIKNHLDSNAGWDGTLFETYGAELEHVLSFANCFDKQKRVWTLVESDGNMSVSAGYHMINRMGYFITEKPWETGSELFEIEGVDDDKPLSYILYKDDYSDREFYDLIKVEHGLPEYADLFDRDGEVCEDYSHLFREGASVEVQHENIRIHDEETLQVFLLDDANTTNSMDEAIKNAIHGVGAFQVAGDGGGLGFIVDVWKTQEDMENDEPWNSFQFWFEDYEND